MKQYLLEIIQKLTELGYFVQIDSLNYLRIYINQTHCLFTIDLDLKLENLKDDIIEEKNKFKLINTIDDFIDRVRKNA